jgi:hypothetical protein
LKRATSASNKAVPTPFKRSLGSIWMANTQPAGGWPNSQARISPAMKPASALVGLGHRKCGRGPACRASSRAWPARSGAHPGRKSPADQRLGRADRDHRSWTECACGGK